MFIVVLAMNVTLHRVTLRVSLGDGGKPQMHRMIRLHGSAVEYVPLGVLLMGLYELDGGSPFALHASGVALILGRLLFVAGVWNHDAANPIRGAAAVLTWLVIAALAILNLWQIRSTF